MVVLLAQHKELESVTLSNASSPCNSKTFLVQVMINQIFNKMQHSAEHDTLINGALTAAYTRAFQSTHTDSILLMVSNMHHIPVQNTGFFMTYLHHNLSFWWGISLTVIFSTLSWVEEDLKNVALDLCCCCPALLAGYRAMPGAHSHNGDIYFISLFSALRKQAWVNGRCQDTAQSNLW